MILCGDRVAPEKLDFLTSLRRISTSGKQQMEVVMGLHRPGPMNPNWRGGRRLSAAGYVLLWVGDRHPMANAKGVVREHRLVMSESLGRVLRSDEVVHHIDGNRQNNDLGNLRIMTPSDHMRLHSTGRPMSAEAREKLAAPKRGIPRSEELKRKVSETKRNDPRTTVVAKENMRKRSKLCEDDIREIRRLLSERVYHHDIAARFGVKRSVITSINLGNAWADVGLDWETKGNEE